MEFRAKQATYRMYEELRRHARELVYAAAQDNANQETKDVADKIYLDFEE